MEKGTFCNKLPVKIEINVYYIEDEEGFITEIDEDSMEEEFKEKLKELKSLRTK